MAPNIPQSGTAGRSVWYTGVRSLFRVFEPGGCDDVEAGARLYGRAGAVRAAPRGAGPRGYRRQRDDDHRPGGRPELLHDERRVRRRPQGMRAGVRQSRRAARRPVERRDDLRPGELQARRSAELEAGAVHRSQGEGDGDAPHGERSPHDRDQDGLGRDLMRRTLGGGAAVLSAALLACGSRAPSGFTLLFLGRSPAASVDDLSWAPDPERSRLVAFDRQLRLARRLTSPRLGTLRVPAVPLLTHLVNAGAVAVGPDGSVYYAPLVRDEIRKYAPSGAPGWTTRRGLMSKESEPVFLPARGKGLRLANALVNVALALGPDGRLYALRADDSAATRLRVDVLDTATGAIVATRHLGPRETAVAVSAAGGGGLATFDGDSLLGAAPAAPALAREPFAPAFALPDLGGDTVPLSRFAGKVTLVNFWASWCDPCREEFPHMAELYREFDRRDFEIAAISDDVDRGKMRAFVQQFRPPFPILVGGGRMKQTYHYRGLPYSVLLDRRGRVIERIFGFGGADEFRTLRETIAHEARAP